MTKEQVIERFCKLSGQVASSQKFEWSEPVDCFCGKAHPPGWNYCFSEKVMSFIETAVQKELNN